MLLKMQQPASKEEVFFRLFEFLMFQPFLAILVTKKRSENRLLKHTHRRKMASLFNKFQQVNELSWLLCLILSNYLNIVSISCTIYSNGYEQSLTLCSILGKFGIARNRLEQRLNMNL